MAVPVKWHCLRGFRTTAGRESDLMVRFSHVLCLACCQSSFRTQAEPGSPKRDTFHHHHYTCHLQTWFSPKLRMGNLARIPWLQRKKPLAESQREGGGGETYHLLKKESQEEPKNQKEED